MRDALGGTVNIALIVFFMALVIGYLAFNVNYTRAFRMKNKIIAVYEDYNGDCSSECLNEIISYADQVGYRPDRNSNCEGGYKAIYRGSSPLYCYKDVPVDSSLSGDRDVFSDIKGKHYFSIETKISVDIPIVRNVIGDLRYFWVKGDTKAFKKE